MVDWRERVSGASSAPVCGRRGQLLRASTRTLNVRGSFDSTVAATVSVADPRSWSMPGSTPKNVEQVKTLGRTESTGRRWPTIAFVMPMVSRLSARTFGAITGTTSPSTQSSRRNSRKQIEDQLNAGQKAKRSLHFFVSGSLSFVGLLCGVVSQFGYQNLEVGASCWVWGTIWGTVCLCLLMLSLAPLPDNVILARVVIVANVIVLYTEMHSVLFLTDYVEDIFGIGVPTEQLGYTSVITMFFVISIFAFCQHGSANVQKYMWRSVRFYFTASACFDSFLTLVGLFAEIEDFLCAAPYVVSGVIFSLLSWTPGVRPRVQASLLRLFDRYGSGLATAAVAGLLGDCTAKEVVGQASKRFRCIKFSQLAKEDLASSNTDPGLYSKSVPVRIGWCDAFVSHSWSDDPESKWRALEQWVREFEEQNGREPTLWLDKCCIDQNDIATDLRCLPIFIHGCKQMVVLWGVSYFTRLWCVAELFTFHLMDDICLSPLSLIPVLRESSPDEDRAKLQGVIDDFDVEDCECSKYGDKARIMDIFMAAYGDPTCFNDAVRRIIRDRDKARLPGCDWGSDIESDVDALEGP